MIRRLVDPAVLQARVLEPDMDGLTASDFDAAEWLSDPNNLALTDGHNVMLFASEDGTTWQGHWLLRDKGKTAFLTAVEFLRYLYLAHEARLVTGYVPAHCRASRWFTRQMGFNSHGLKQTEDGEQEFFSMSREEFEARYGLFEKQKEVHQPRKQVGQQHL